MPSFEESWMFVNEANQALGASGYDLNPTADRFRSGRPKFEAVFYSGTGHERTVIERRTGMELHSAKTGKPYHVVSRQPAAAGPCAGAFTLNDVFVS